MDYRIFKKIVIDWILGFNLLDVALWRFPDEPNVLNLLVITSLRIFRGSMFDKTESQSVCVFLRKLSFSCFFFFVNCL